MIKRGNHPPIPSKPRAFFEAALPTKTRKRRTDTGSGDAVLLRAGNQLRIQARHLDENHDLAKGVLDTLVNRTVGRGIRFEPQVLDTSGNIHEDMNQAISDLHTRWSEAPTVLGEEYSRTDMERLMALTWFRDGEVFKTYHIGAKQDLRHHLPQIPLSLQLFEPDYCPLIYNDTTKSIRQGVERNRWGRITAYHFYQHHPGDVLAANGLGLGYVRVNADYVNHLKTVRRIGQSRGISVFHAVLNRLDDLKDYEEAERIAARIAAKMVGYIRKGSPDMYGDDDFAKEERESQHFENGMTLFDMLPGEEVGIFDTKRPNTGLADFRAGQLRAVAAGTSTSYSSAAKDYGGTYSAQRQELVEQQEAYEVLQEYFIQHACKPDYRRFVEIAILNGALRPPLDANLDTIYDVSCYGSTMPWIDPAKEAAANQILLKEGLISRSEIIRRRGGNPLTVFRQIQRDKQLMAEFGIAIEHGSKK